MKRIPVPSIDEINETHAGSNGLTCISTFAGAGGSSTGYKWAGFRVPVALEFVDKAAETYRANAPHTEVIERDVRDVSGAELLEKAGVGFGELDVLDGSPPCQAFSTAGLRDEGWGEEKQYSGRYKQRTDDLFDQYVRLIDETHPKVFVAENVKGLVSGVAQGYFKEIFGKLQAAGPGYRVQAQLIRAHQLGVPQKRDRVIFIGVREDLNRNPAFPRPYHKKFVTLREAIEGLPDPEPHEASWLREGTRTRMAWDYTDVIRDPQGCFRHAYQRLYNKDARYMWFKLAPNAVCPTVCGKVPTLFRWDVPRTLSIHEAKRVCSFPDDFVLPGKFKHQWERLGRSVPPLMMRWIARTIAEEIFDAC